MPVTGWAGLEDCLAGIVAGPPAAVLDAGSGSGIWGCLLREYLDVALGRTRPEQWRTRIDAVERDPSRVQPYARALYTEVLIGDVREVVPRRAAEVHYDVILFAEVIEELYKDDGRALLEVAAGLADRLVLRIRLGDDWRFTGDPGGQISCWYAKDFIDRSFGGRPCRLHEYGPDRCAVVTVGAAGG